MNDNAFIPHVPMQAYRYELPADRIARFPLAERDQSKLLVADARNKTFHHRTFRDLPDVLPDDTMLIRNNTRVIAARLFMQKPTGGGVEVMCIEPVLPSTDAAQTLMSKGRCSWLAIVGGRNVKSDMTLSAQGRHESITITLNATLREKREMEAVIDFQWSPESLLFATVLESLGHIPLPPYLKRDATDADSIRYQTVYAEHLGSVAAPTAGLHFTNTVLTRLAGRNIPIHDVTLHVGLGTFKPVVAEDASGHTMHTERLFVSHETLSAIATHLASGKHIVAVGTTSFRTMESLYWFGVRLVSNDGNAFAGDMLAVSQWDAYRLKGQSVTPTAAFHALLDWMKLRGLATLAGDTQILVVPSYEPMACSGLLTNFHQPESTLMLLVAAFLGGTFWRDVYDAALQNNYRFLSYGDSSLLLR
jgi:S-adenosylmethionine:tRNA ribosyltransferase-isomerase